MNQRSKLQAEAAEILGQEAETGVVPGVPEGVEADVNVRYRTRIATEAQNPKLNAQNSDNDDELNRLALEFDNPPDPLSDFLERFALYVGYNCMILRLPDPSTRRMHGQTYARPHWGQPEQLGAVTFDPNPINFISSLQIVNGNSGGCFQIWLMDHAGRRIEDAVLHSVAIADPPARNERLSLVTGQPPAVIPVPQRSESERKLEEAKDRLFNSALERALNPPVVTAAGSTLSGEDQAALFLFKQTDFLSNVYGKMSEMATQAAGAGVAKDPTLRDRALDALVTVATNNPQIVERVGGVLERIIARLLPDPRFDNPPLQPPSYYQPQPPSQQQPQAQTQASYTSPNPGGMPEAPDPDDETEDDDTMDILDQLAALLNSNEVLTLDAPVIQQLIREYPIKARLTLRMIANQPLDDIINWIKDTGGPLYVSLLDGPASGPFLRQRLSEFKALCETAANKAQAAQAPQETVAPDSPENSV